MLINFRQEQSCGFPRFNFFWPTLCGLMEAGEVNGGPGVGALYLRLEQVAFFDGQGRLLAESFLIDSGTLRGLPSLGVVQINGMRDLASTSPAGAAS